MLSNKEIICPDNLLNVAHKKKGVKAGIVNAGKPLPMQSVQDAVKENLIEPIFIGDEKEINKCAQDLKWDISNYEIIHEPVENNTAMIAAKLASEQKIKIIVKGHIHTDVLMKEVLKREYNLLGKTRLSHIWHMTLGKEDKPLIITDGALNVLPNVKTKLHILKNVINFSNRIGIERPKVAILSATEEVLDSVPSSKEAEELTNLAKKENLNADVFGPLAFDNSISKKSAAIKGIKNLVAGEAAGLGVSTDKSAATTKLGKKGVLHGSKTLLMQDENGQVTEPYSISAGLDYPGIGPLHAHLFDSNRGEYISVDDDEAMNAGIELSRLEGIIPAIETAHAFSVFDKLDMKGKVVVINLSGRGDKDLETYIKWGKY
mgnify:CR=1 FL=1